MFAGVQVVVVVIHGPVGIEPTLKSLAPVLGAIRGSIALLVAPEDDENLVLARDRNVGSSRLSVHQNVSAREALLQ